METSQLILFLMASLAVILTPGQDFILVLSRAVSQGSRAGVITASGVATGLLGHAALASLGLGAILLASATLFTLIKTIGACYLFYLGIRLLFSRSSRIELHGDNDVSPGKLFFTGAFSNISNPHITIFYFAFLPQFIPAGVQHPTLYLLALGVSFAAMTLVIKTPLGYFAGTLSSWLCSHPAVLKGVERTSGLMLIGLGCKLVLSERS